MKYCKSSRKIPVLRMLGPTKCTDGFFFYKIVSFKPSRDREAIIVLMLLVRKLWYRVDK